MAQAFRPLAMVTGASSGIGLELARRAARQGFSLVIAARDARIVDVAHELRAFGNGVEPVEADLSTLEGVDRLCAAAARIGRPVEALFANAGRGLGHAFVDQDFADIQQVIATNITGTVYLLHRIVRDMRDRGAGRILITGSIAGFMPGTFQAVYNGTKAFVDSFAIALRHELKDSGVSVTCLMPGPTATELLKKAGVADTNADTDEKDDPADVAKTGFDAMMRGEASVVHGAKNKAQRVMGEVLPQGVVAELHRGVAAPRGRNE